MMPLHRLAALLSFSWILGLLIILTTPAANSCMSSAAKMKKKKKSLVYFSMDIQCLCSWQLTKPLGYP